MEKGEGEEVSQPNLESDRVFEVIGADGKPLGLKFPADRPPIEYEITTFPKPIPYAMLESLSRAARALGNQSE